MGRKGFGWQKERKNKEIKIILIGDIINPESQLQPYIRNSLPEKIPVVLHMRPKHERKSLLPVHLTK